jgi:hypothetical protein
MLQQSHCYNDLGSCYNSHNVTMTLDPVTTVTLLQQWPWIMLQQSHCYNNDLGSCYNTTLLQQWPWIMLQHSQLQWPWIMLQQSHCYNNDLGSCYNSHTVTITLDHVTTVTLLQQWPWIMLQHSHCYNRVSMMTTSNFMWCKEYLGREFRLSQQRVLRWLSSNRPADGGNKQLWNVAHSLSDYTAQLRRPLNTFRIYCNTVQGTNFQSSPFSLENVWWLQKRHLVMEWQTRFSRTVDSRSWDQSSLSTWTRAAERFHSLGAKCRETVAYK